MEVSQEYWLGDQTKLEALVRFSDEELKHQELFRRIDRLAGEAMPEGYAFVPEPNAVAGAVLASSSWAVMALTLDIELFTQAHYRQSIEPDTRLSPLWKDVFLYHWKEESQHAILDELEWVKMDAAMSAEERDTALEEFIGLVGAVDSILQAQSEADAAYFAAACGRKVEAGEQELVAQAFLKAYRWQYIFSGAEHPHFLKVLTSLIDEEQTGRVVRALASIEG